MRVSIALLCGLTAVAGCGSSTELTGVALYDQKFANGDAIFDTFLDTAVPIGSLNDLPDTGTATYNGQIAVNVNNADIDTVIGDVTFDVIFAPSADPISGSAGNFVDNLGDSYAGVLQVSNSSITDATVFDSVGFEADLDGVLNQGTPDFVIVNTTLDGEFGAAVANPSQVIGMLGDVDGVITTVDGSFTVDGGLIAVQ